MSWFTKLFQKKEDIFIKLLIEQARIGVEGIDALRTFMSSGDDVFADQVRHSEQAADEVRRILIDEINRSFVTPFDREDIHNLSRAIDDILDYAFTTVDEMRILKLKPNETLLKLTTILLEAAKEIHLAVQRLEKNPNVANEHARRAKSFENKMETTYREALAALFDSPKEIQDVSHVFKCREIYRHLGNAADRADQAANIISDIVVKTT